MVWSSFQNLVPYRKVLGEQTDALIARAHLELGRLGVTLSVSADPESGESGQHIATVAGGTEGDVIDLLRPLSWLAYGLLGLTEAWSISIGDLGESNTKNETLVASRMVELACGLRFGIAEIGSAGADPSSLLELAQTSCNKQKADKRGITRHGFPALWPERFRTLVHVGDPTCPRCTHIATDAIGESTCEECKTSYQRGNVYLVGGRLIRGRVL